ncbi:MAG: PAS domain S-box protein [Chlamydiota bacterium]
MTRSPDTPDRRPRDARLLSLIAANIRDMVVFVDLDGRIQWVNKAVEKQFGYTREELIGAHVYTLQAPGKNSPGIWSPGGTGELFEKWAGVIVDRRKDGSEFAARVESFLVRDEHGSVTGIASISRDISEMVRAEEALRESEANFRAFFESVTDMIMVGTTDGRLLFTNAAVTRTLGYSPDELRGMHLRDVYPADKRREAEEIFAAMLRGEREICPLPLARKDGAVVPVETRVWFGWWNGVDCIFGVSKNLTAEQEAQQRFERLFRNNPALMALSTVPDQRFSDVNDAFLKALGYSRDDIVGKTVVELGLFLHAELQAAIADTLQADGHIADFELQVRRKDGAILDGIFSGELIDIQGRQYFLTVMIDITERNRAEEKVLEMERRLLRAQKIESLGVLAGGIAHDFNNLLTAILGNLDLALCDLSPVSPARTSVGEAIHATRRAEVLTRQMLAYSGKGRFIIADLDLSELVEENAHLLKAVLSKSTTLNLYLGRELPPISADAGQIQQVVMNLVTNASESLGEQAGIVALSTGVLDCDDEAYLIRSRIEKKPAPGRYVFLDVTDTGCGMDEETKGRLFDPFFTTKFTGRGLGMSAVLGIVRGHEGAIMVESEVGKGTTVRVLFPVSKTAPAGRGRKDKIAKGGMRAAGTPPLPGTVLVVDDEECVRRPCAAMVTHAGYRALTAANGDEAVALLRDHADEIVCVILDLTMPGKDGVATFEALRRIKPDVKVILSSGYNEREATQRFPGKGLAGFIKKPYEMAALLAELSRVARPPALRKGTANGRE